MALPTLATIEDIKVICGYLVTKSTGATLNEAKSVIDKKHLRGEKIAALKFWELIEQDEGKYKVSAKGRKCTKNQKDMTEVLTEVIRSISPYNAIVERALHRKEDSLTATDVAAHWHDHFRNDAGESEGQLNKQAVCFFQVAEGAGLGNLIIGRKGAPTRFSFSIEALKSFIRKGVTVAGKPILSDTDESPKDHVEKDSEEINDQYEAEEQKDNLTPSGHHDQPLGQGIFIAHGKNKKPLEQLKKILDQFKIPYKVAVDEPNLGRPISGKVREVMESCNCAILIFTADEEFKDKDGNTIWRPSENVVFELGATGYLYDNRIVIMKEDGVTFPSNFSDIGYITFDKNQLDAKALDILKELIGFGIVKVTT